MKSQRSGYAAAKASQSGWRRKWLMANGYRNEIAGYMANANIVIISENRRQLSAGVMPGVMWRRLGCMAKWLQQWLMAKAV